MSRVRFFAPGSALDRQARRWPRSVNFTALSTRFSSAARSRISSPATCRGQLPRDHDIGGRAPWPRARAASARPTASASRRGENGSCRSVSRAASALAASMIKVVIAARCSAPLFTALAHCRSRSPRSDAGEQLGQREDAGQRRADVVRDAGKRSFDRARPGLRAQTPRSGRLFAAPCRALPPRLGFSFRHSHPQCEDGTEGAINRGRRACECPVRVTDARLTRRSRRRIACRSVRVEAGKRLQGWHR